MTAVPPRSESMDPDRIGEEGWYCEKCGRMFDDIIVLEVHSMRGHDDSKVDEVYVCKDCFRPVNEEIYKDIKR